MDFKMLNTLGVVGNKTDSIRDSGGVANDQSLMNYMKGLIQEMHQRYIPKLVTMSTSSLTITDKGILTGISQLIKTTTDTSVEGFGTISITIDGTSLGGTIYASYINSYWLSGAGGFLKEYEPFSLSFNHRFNTSLSITTSCPTNAQVITTVAYTIDN